jgi:hypothetical protein
MANCRSDRSKRNRPTNFLCAAKFRKKVKTRGSTRCGRRRTPSHRKGHAENRRRCSSSGRPSGPRQANRLRAIQSWQKTQTSRSRRPRRIRSTTPTFPDISPPLRKSPPQAGYESPRASDSPPSRHLNQLLALPVIGGRWPRAHSSKHFENRPLHVHPRAKRADAGPGKIFPTDSPEIASADESPPDK